MSEYIVRMPPSMPYEIRAELNAWYVESEPIVRCKDCKHKYGCVHLIEVMQEDGEGDMIRCKAIPDGYCKWGERRVRE